MPSWCHSECSFYGIAQLVLHSVPQPSQQPQLDRASRVNLCLQLHVGKQCLTILIQSIGISACVMDAVPMLTCMRSCFRNKSHSKQFPLQTSFGLGCVPLAASFGPAMSGLVKAWQDDVTQCTVATFARCPYRYIDLVLCLSKTTCVTLITCARHA